MFTFPDEEGALLGTMDIAIPASWLSKDASLDLKPTTLATAYEDGADIIIGPGTFGECHSDIETLHAWVSLVHALVQKGYIDERRALLPFAVIHYNLTPDGFSKAIVNGNGEVSPCE
jgi:hypothetical protein